MNLHFKLGILLSILLILVVGCNHIEDNTEVSINHVLINNTTNLGVKFRNLSTRNVTNTTENKTLKIINITKENNCLGKISAKTKCTYKHNNKTSIKKISISLIGTNLERDLCGIKVNNKTEWISSGSRKFIDGISIRVFDAFFISSDPMGSACEVMIGGNMFILTTEKK